MKPTDFSVHVTSFLMHYLAAQRNVSYSYTSSWVTSSLRSVRVA